MQIKTLAYRIKRSILLLGLLAASSVTCAHLLNDYTAHYKISYGAIKLGTITFRFQKEQNTDCFSYSGQGKPLAIARLFAGNRFEQSHFCLTKDNHIRATKFKKAVEGKPEKSYQVELNWNKQQAFYKADSGQTAKIRLDQAIADPLSLHAALRLWLASTQNPSNLVPNVFSYIKNDAIKHTTLKVSKAGNIRVPAGLYQTVLVEQVEQGDKQMRFWLARYADWLPVKIEHETNGHTISMQLIDISH